MTNKFIVSMLLSACVLGGCSSEIKKTSQVTPTTNEPVIGNEPIVGTSGFKVRLSNNNVILNEGSSITIDIKVERAAGGPAVNLAVQGQSDNDTNNLSWDFSDTQVSGSNDSVSLTIRSQLSVLPIQRQVRTLRVVGSAANSQSVITEMNVEIAPTTLTDVYLLVGQSNMVGFSEDDAKQALAGQLDEPNDRIKQLNVTGNDFNNFPTIESFTSANSIAVTSPQTTLAIDPLHTGFDSRINGKEGTYIGMGLSFAKRALSDTASTIYLVPAAWSDTGFCKRNRTDFVDELGWNAKPTTNPALSGTLLHDRALARANLALRETGGILRGILWHQGEADSDDINCAQAYEENIRELVASLRTNIIQDARGPSARGSNANVPFVLGTMSKGGAYSFQPEPKQIVDGVHRNIANVVPFSAFVSNDDLIPPAYQCGAGDCIHFGSTSYREMGSRYYDFLKAASQR